MASESHPAGLQNGRRMAAAALLGLGAGAFALWLYRRSRRGKKKNKQRRSGPSLAEEIEAALALEEAEIDVLELEELKADFEAATTWVGGNGGGLPNGVLLELYGCYKQALVGDSPPDRPRSMEAGMKWDSWHEMAGTARFQAMRSYVSALKKCVPTWTAESTEDAAPKGAGASGTFGNSVSTMGQVGDSDDVDETPVGQLNEMIHNEEFESALEVLRKAPKLAFESDKDGMTPMHWATDSGSCEVMEALLALLGSEAKARINQQDVDGSTPLDYAVLIETEDAGARLEMARLLAKAGADPAAGSEEIPEDWKSLFADS